MESLTNNQRLISIPGGLIMYNNEQIIVLNDGIDPIAFDSINHISGVYAAVLWESLYDVFWSVDVLKNIHNVFSILSESRYNEEAFSLLRSYFDILDLDWAIELDVVDQIPELKEHFIYEFLQDAGAIISEYEYEESLNR